MNHIRGANQSPTRPGTVLTDSLASSGKSKTEIASLLGISRTLPYQICWGERAVSPAMAARVGKLLVA